MTQNIVKSFGIDRNADATMYFARLSRMSTYKTGTKQIYDHVRIDIKQEEKCIKSIYTHTRDETTEERVHIHT
jgi:hypothetical protein